MIVIYHNSRCGKSRYALSRLESSEVEIIEYLKMPPTAAEIKEIVKKTGLSIKSIIRKKEKLFVEKFKDNQYSEDQWAEILSQNPILIERPILMNENIAVIARTEEKINEFLNDGNSNKN